MNHCIIVEDLKIALSLKGVVSYFPVSKPTKEEYESSSHENRIVLTYDSPVWDPHTTRFGKAEEAMLDYQGNLQEQKVKKTSKVLSTIYSIPSYDLFYCHFGKLINICSLQTAEFVVKWIMSN